MVQIREIIPGVFQCFEGFDREIRSAFYMKRSFGNYLFYQSYLHASVYRLIRDHGGLVKYFHKPNFEDDDHARQLFARFGCSSVLMEAPRDPSRYRWELYADRKVLYRGLNILSLPDAPKWSLYLLQNHGQRLLLSSDLLALNHGHWEINAQLDQGQIQELCRMLGDLNFDYILPQYASGYISFQKVDQDFKEIQLRALSCHSRLKS